MIWIIGKVDRKIVCNPNLNVDTESDDWKLSN